MSDKYSTEFIASTAFLDTYDWRKLRMQALIKYGTRCRCCGATPSDGVRLNVDHIKPRKTHPELALDIDNLQILCNLCNHGKANWDDTNWRKSNKRSIVPNPVADGNYIARKRSAKVVHIWIGNDTACHQFSGAKWNLDRFVRTDNSVGLPVCEACRISPLAPYPHHPK